MRRRHAYYLAPGWHPDASWSVDGLVQQALATKDGFKPGTQYQLKLVAGRWSSG